MRCYFPLATGLLEEIEKHITIKILREWTLGSIWEPLEYPIRPIVNGIIPLLKLEQVACRSPAGVCMVQKPVRGFVAEYFVTNSRYLVYICTWGCKPNQSGTKYAPYNLAAELTRSAKGTLGVIIPVVSEKDCHVFLRICSDDADIRFTTTLLKNVEQQALCDMYPCVRIRMHEYIYIWQKSNRKMCICNMSIMQI